MVSCSHVPLSPSNLTIVSGMALASGLDAWAIGRDKGSCQLFASCANGMKVGVTHGFEVGAIGPNAVAGDQVGDGARKPVVGHSEIAVDEAAELAGACCFMEAPSSSVLGLAVGNGK